MKPCFRLEPQDKRLLRFLAVRQYLRECARRIHAALRPCPVCGKQEGKP